MEKAPFCEKNEALCIGHLKMQMKSKEKAILSLMESSRTFGSHFEITEVVLSL